MREGRAPAPPTDRDPAPKIAATAFDPAGDRFELGDELGRGGMGRVVAATDRALAREVAIKQALADDDVDLARFEREVRITARLEHPAIVPVHDAGRDRNGRPFYVMRRLQGRPLSDRIHDAAGPRERLALVPYVLSAVDAAAFAHARNVIHRDIKPSNILVGEYGETLLIDWGLARELSEDPDRSGAASTTDGSLLTQVGHVIGTPGYMAPEQQRGELADTRADVYALGATLAEVLSGQPPPKSTRFDDDVPQELIAIVRKATADEPAARYADAGELAADLRAFLAGKLVAAHRYTRWQRIARFVRAHRVSATMVAIALALAIAVGSIAIVNIVRERDRADAARRDAEQERELADDRAETMLLDRASAIAESDPTRAVALLRGIPQRSRNLRRARDIAAVATNYGVARGVATSLDAVTILAFTPDGKSLVASGMSGEVYVFDRRTAAMRKFPSLGRDANLAVFAGNRMVINAHRGLFERDLRTGDARTLDADARVTALWRVGDRIRYVDDNTRRLLERPLGPRGEQKTLAEHVTTAFEVGEHVVFSDGKAVHLIGKSTDVVLSTESDVVSFDTQAVSRDGQRFALVGFGLIVEYDLTGRERGRWKIQAIRAFYSPRMLYAQTQLGDLLTCLPPNKTNELTRTEMLLWQVPFRDGFAALAQSGTLRLVDAAGMHAFHQEFDGSRVLAIDRTESAIAIGSQRGVVRWIELAPIAPPQYPSVDYFTPCWVDDDHIYVAGSWGIDQIDRKTGNARLFRVREPITGCLDMIGTHLFAAGFQRVLDIDVDTGQIARALPFGSVDRRIERYFYGRDHQIVELDPTTGHERVIYEGPARISSLTSNGRWILAELEGSVIVRVDRETGAVLGIPHVTTPATVLADGTIAYVADESLVLSTGLAIRRIPLPHGTVDTVTENDDHVAIRMADGSLWWFDGITLANRAPAGMYPIARWGPRDLVLRYQSHQEVQQIHMRTGEIERRRTRAIGAQRGAGGLVLVVTHSAYEVLDETVPADPQKLHAWIDATTNARIEHGVLVWSAPNEDSIR